MNTYQKRILFRIISLLGLGFVGLTALVLFFPLSNIDRQFSEEVQEHHNHALDALMEGISWFGYMPTSLIIVLLVAAIFFLFKRRREALFLVITLGSGIVSSVIKILVNRPRPTENLVRIVEKARHQSFPSGHTLFYVVFFGFLTLLMVHLKHLPKALRFGVSTFCLFLIFAVPLARIYLGAHWFTDVLGGFLLGLIYLFILGFYYLKS